ncbi:ectoine hydroxylase [Streptomyces sp. TS71-3]|uniref:ectoine hydroxylase n=1 Tax=Streptomyces sp. TS71-3 TaxID=2733862 RepID=UPI001B21674A|nr:ectoine hydroxylase [Streptomyces sp. TS71-3]GHJ41602.1 ectoine hydroxylase [Streptomyces sp. TS71-3]
MNSAVLTDPYRTRVPERTAAVPRHDPVVYGAPADGPLSDRALAGFDERGYHNDEALVSAADVSRLTEEIGVLAADEEIRAGDLSVIEENSQEVRSIFDVHLISGVFRDLVRDPRVLGPVRQILGSEVYVHQSRVNYKPGFGGGPFYWHSDFETWHAEDGMPTPRAVSVSIALTENYPYNGSLMIIPGSHRTYVPCVGETPKDHHRNSLRTHKVAIGMPDTESVTELAEGRGIEQFTGPAGSATIFDSNCMHGSNGNITPYSRSNVFVVFNSVDNTLREPYAAPQPRPEHIAKHDFTPVTPRGTV